MRPQAIYLHSALTKGRIPVRNDAERTRVLRFERLDVIIALSERGHARDRGVPLSLLRRLLAIERLEVLPTSMVRDPSRFMKEENYGEPLTALFGGDVWRECEDTPNCPECLLLRFQPRGQPVSQSGTPDAR